MKRQRCANFTPEEEAELVALVKANQSVLENKKSDAITWKQKALGWEKLATEFTSITGVQCTVSVLKSKYEGLKRKSRTEFAEEKRNLFKTGGGPQSKTCVSAVSEQIIEMIGESATGGENVFDSDYVLCEVEMVEDKGVHANEALKISMESPTNEAETNYSQFDDKWTPAQLKKPVSKKLTNKRANCASSVQTAKEEMMLAQKKFYNDENERAKEKHLAEMERAKEKHSAEMEVINLKRELLEFQLVEEMKKYS
ncbi:hypothetical protein ACLKA6_001664 [Drosophila palustris]